MTGISIAGLRRGLAAYVGEHTSGVWSQDVPYAPGDWAVTLRDLPSQPDTAVAVEIYNFQSELVLPGAEIRVQFTFRGRGDDADDFADELYAVLHGKHRFAAGDVSVQRARHLYAAPLGVDENGRERRTDNYELILMSTPPVR